MSTVASEAKGSDAAIKKQVDFYFSDSNFRKDTFLKAAAETDPEGYIPIAVLLTFNRMKALNATVAEIAAAVDGSEIVELNADKTKLRKSTPLPAEDTSKEKTLYVKGYPEGDNDVTIEQVAGDFSRFGTVRMVRLRRALDTKAFKGSVFIEFDSETAVQAAVAAFNSEEKLSYKGTPFLCVMPLSEWLGKKEAKKAASSARKSSNERPAKKVATEEGPKEIAFTSGLIVKVQNVPGDASHFQLKDFFGTYGEIRYVESITGENAAYVRVSDPVTAAAIIAATESETGVKFTPEGEKMTASTVTADEEKEYWEKIATQGQASYQKRQNNRSGGRGGGRGRGGRGGRGGGGRGREGRQQSAGKRKRDD